MSPRHIVAAALGDAAIWLTEAANETKHYSDRLAEEIRNATMVVVEAVAVAAELLDANENKLQWDANENKPQWEVPEWPGCTGDDGTLGGPRPVSPHVRVWSHPMDASTSSTFRQGLTSGCPHGTMSA